MKLAISLVFAMLTGTITSACFLPSASVGVLPAPSYLPPPTGCLPPPIGCQPAPPVCLPSPVECVPPPTGCIPPPTGCLPPQQVYVPPQQVYLPPQPAPCVDVLPAPAYAPPAYAPAPLLPAPPCGGCGAAPGLGLKGLGCGLGCGVFDLKSVLKEKLLALKLKKCACKCLPLLNAANSGTLPLVL